MGYIINSFLISFCLFIFYKCVLENEKNHQFNRFYLLMSLVLSIIVPLLDLSFLFSNQVIQEPINQISQVFTAERSNVSELVETNQSIDLWFLLYGTLCVILLFRLIWRVSIFQQISVKEERIERRTHRLILTRKLTDPFTFMKSVFLNKDAFNRGEIEPEILRHEQCHAEQYHSLDVLFAECVKIAFWMNPIMYLFKKSIQLNHEFIADEYVLSKSDSVRDYQYLLLQKSTKNKYHYLASNINFIMTKKRLLMMKKSKSPLRLIKAISAIPFMILLSFLFSNNLIGQADESKVSTMSKDRFYEKTVFECKNDKGQKVFKKYTDLTDEEKSKIPPPPPPPPLPPPPPPASWKETSEYLKSSKKAKPIKPAEMAPLPEGTIIRLDESTNNVFVEKSQLAPPPPPPPPPPAPKLSSSNIPPPPPPIDMEELKNSGASCYIDGKISNWDVASELMQEKGKGYSVKYKSENGKIIRVDFNKIK